MSPAGEWLHQHGVGGRISQTVEGEPSAPGGLLPGPVESEPLERLIRQQGADGGDARPVAQAFKPLLTAVRQFAVSVVSVPGLSASQGVLHLCPMGHAITIRLSDELAAWLEAAAAQSGVSQGKLIRDQLEKARASGEAQGFLRLAGAVSGPEDLSRRKGFSRS